MHTTCLCSGNVWGVIVDKYDGGVRQLKPLGSQIVDSPIWLRQTLFVGEDHSISQHIQPKLVAEDGPRSRPGITQERNLSGFSYTTQKLNEFSINTVAHCKIMFKGCHFSICKSIYLL